MRNLRVPYKLNRLWLNDTLLSFEISSFFDSHQNGWCFLQNPNLYSKHYTVMRGRNPSLTSQSTSLWFSDEKPHQQWPLMDPLFGPEIKLTPFAPGTNIKLFALVGWCCWMTWWLDLLLFIPRLFACLSYSKLFCCTTPVLVWFAYFYSLPNRKWFYNVAEWRKSCDIYIAAFSQFIPLNHSKD